jgi:hypothetical protein
VVMGCALCLIGIDCFIDLAFLLGHSMERRDHYPTLSTSVGKLRLVLHNIPCVS